MSIFGHFYHHHSRQSSFNARLNRFLDGSIFPYYRIDPSKGVLGIENLLDGNLKKEVNGEKKREIVRLLGDSVAILLDVLKHTYIGQFPSLVLFGLFNFFGEKLVSAINVKGQISIHNGGWFMSGGRRKETALLLIMLVDLTASGSTP